MLDDEASDDPNGEDIGIDICFWEAKVVELDPSDRLRFHVASAKHSGRLACGAWLLSECRPLGGAWPERGGRCRTCRRLRPETELLDPAPTERAVAPPLPA